MSLRAAVVDGRARFCPSTSRVGSLVVLTAISLTGLQAARADEAQDLLRKMNSLYTGARSYAGTVTIHTNGKSPQNGQAYTVTTIKRVRYKSPNQLHLDLSVNGTGALARMTQNGLVVSNGHTIFQYSPQQKQYVKNAAPPRIMLPQVLNLPNLPSATFKVVGSTTVNGHAASELEARLKMPTLPPNTTPQTRQRIEQQIQKPVRLVIDRQNGALLHLSQETMGGAITIDYTGQTFNGSIPASAFAFKPPAGAKPFTPSAPAGMGGPGPGRGAPVKPPAPGIPGQPGGHKP
ncbi:MAG TPA: DUF2092 domain-containing protein [Chthonomonadaceae bacterium]|nr:DUF2092 domain-containing protein [Chthonomonadaceae bacterium]